MAEGAVVVVGGTSGMGREVARHYTGLGRDDDVNRAIRLTTLKLVGDTEVIHALLDRMGESSSIVLFGGLAKERPYPGSTTVATVNGGIATMINALAVE